MSWRSLDLPWRMAQFPTDNFLYTQTTRESVATRIRQLRKSRGWTLADVEIASRGKIKAVVIGSYERGDRSMSVERAIEIADLFGLPLSEFLSTPTTRPAATGNNSRNFPNIVIDLRKAKRANFADQESGPQLSLFLAWIIGLRQDWNGEVLSLRKSDIDIMALLMFKTPREVVDWLIKHHYLISAGDQALT
ncbi:MAG: helix-turn-helix domain-containing protein [Actinobacteria bacterium]|nr:helix-turn-helix domain-containing protein [Actinomycetota bacterium]